MGAKGGYNECLGCWFWDRLTLFFGPERLAFDEIEFGGAHEFWLFWPGCGECSEAIFWICHICIVPTCLGWRDHTFGDISSSRYPFRGEVPIHFEFGRPSTLSYPISRGTHQSEAASRLNVLRYRSATGQLTMSQFFLVYNMVDVMHYIIGIKSLYLHVLHHIIYIYGPTASLAHLFSTKQLCVSTHYMMFSVRIYLSTLWVQVPGPWELTPRSGRVSLLRSKCWEMVKILSTRCGNS